MTKIKRLIPNALIFFPVIVFAQGTTIDAIIDRVIDILVAVVPGLITLALIVFIWGVIKYVTAGDSAEKREQARMVIIYGVVALFAIVAVWGLVKVIDATFGVGIGGTIEIPQF